MGLRDSSAKLFLERNKQIWPRNESPTYQRVAGVPEGARQGWPLFKPAASNLILIPAEIMPQFVQVGQPDLIAVNRGVALGQIPEVFQKKEDLGWQGLAVRQFAVVDMADEQTQDIRIITFRQDGFVGVGLVANGYSLGRGPHGGRQSALRGGHHLLGNSGELGVLHGSRYSRFVWGGH